MNQPLNKNCPICGGYIYLSTARSEICSNCGYVIPQSTYVTTPTDYSCNTTGVAYKYCQKCNTKMVKNGNWYECPNCHYGHMDYLGDPPNIQMFEEDIAITDLIAQNTLTIEQCEKIKMHHKEMDIDFEFDTKKIENIDTIIINGYKFVRERSE